MQRRPQIPFFRFQGAWQETAEYRARGNAFDKAGMRGTQNCRKGWFNLVENLAGVDDADIWHCFAPTGAACSNQPGG